MEAFVMALLWLAVGFGFAALCRLVYEVAYHWDMLRRDRSHD